MLLKEYNDETNIMILTNAHDSTATIDEFY